MLMLFGPCYVYAANEKPIETHNLLGNPVMMDYLTCVQRYGQDFCQCMELDSGTTACYYHRPPAGYYTQERCEQIWGAGQCEEEPSIAPPQNWKLISSSREAGGSQCEGQVMIFPGEKDECRSKTGMIGLGGSCCWQDTGATCSFENTAKTLGWDAGVIQAIKSATEYLASHYVQPVMTDWMNSVLADAGLSMMGSGNPVMQELAGNAWETAFNQQYYLDNGIGSELGDAVLVGDGISPMTDVSSTIIEAYDVPLDTEMLNIVGKTQTDVAAEAANAYKDVLAKTGDAAQAQQAYATTLEAYGADSASAADAASDFAANSPPASAALSSAMSAAAISGVVSIAFSLMDGKLTSQELVDAAIGMAVAFANALVPGNVIAYAYLAYKMYNMLTAETECLPFEYTLACKVGEGYCHYVGERCTAKIFGYCIGKKKVYCCFKSLLARVVHEQGRPQIGLDWGTAKHPKCRGFYPEEFAQLNFAEMDLTEFKNSLKRRANIDIEHSIENAIERFENRLNPPDGE
jgi:hypothetical protein